MKKLEKALEFYADESKWFMKEREVNLRHTTAIFHVDKPEDLPTEFRSKSYECTAILKIDQGKTAREALKEAGNV